jgi:putative Mn2+ efflux pump MntP
MSYFTIFIMSLGLAMDAFAVSISYGCAPRKPSGREMFLIAFLFGSFQAIMPIIGWELGVVFEDLIHDYAHWVAFGLLAYIGIKMIIAGLKGNTAKEDKNRGEHDISIIRLFILAIATSIDSLAVGLSFAVLGYEIINPAIIIGLVTFACSLIGVRAGIRLSAILGTKAEIFGGLVLIAIGIKILVEH